MIAGIVIAAVLIAPPEGPFRWKGEEVQLRPLVQYFRIAPMKEPTPTEVARDPYYGNDPDELARRFAKRPDAESAFAVIRGLAAAELLDGRANPPTNRFASVTASERAYLLRFAASKGHRDALEFFDDRGGLLSGREYDYVLARHRHAYSRRQLPRVETGPIACRSAVKDPIRPYPADAELKKLLDRYALAVHWFQWTTNDALPFFEFTPKACSTNEVPLVVYVPGSGEQGTNLIVQFNQRACLEKVVSAEFQRKHPCRFMIICLSDEANCNSGHGYPMSVDPRSELYHDLILSYAKESKAPAVDPRRIYLTGLGSGGTIAAGLALDHPGRFAAVAPVWYHPYEAIVHPRVPGNWRCYNIFNPDSPDPEDDAERMKRFARRRDEFIANVRAGGGDCSVHYVPRDTPWPWWNVVWSGDEIYDWMFSKTAPAEVR